MKKLLIFCMVLCATAAVSASIVQIGDLYYNLNATAQTAEVHPSLDDKYSGDITIPDSVTHENIKYCVTSIGYAAFQECSDLTSIIIPNSVTSIACEAFISCTGLTSVTIGNSVTRLVEFAFSACTSLTSITIPNSVIYIQDNAFSNCKGLTTLTISSSVQSIGLRAFIGCSGLTSIVVESGNTVYDSREGCNAIIETATNRLIQGCKATVIPNSVTSIGEYAFYDCTSLISIAIPSSVQSIGLFTFAACSGLTSIVVESENMVYDSRENCNALIHTATNTLIRGCQTTTIPNSVTSIGRHAFSGCSSLTSITIPNSVTSIDELAFFDCVGLTSIAIPKSVWAIGPNAFYACSELTSIYFWGTTPPALGNDPFAGVPKDRLTLYIPCGTTSAYQTRFEPQLDDFTNYVEKPMYTLSISSEDEAMGTAQITREAPSCTNNTAIVAATPIEHHHFTQWSDGNTDNPRRVALESDTAFTAVFAIDQHTVTATCDIRQGVVTGAGTFDYGTQIELTAVPNSGYEFQQWSNGLTYNPYRFTVLGDRTLRAEFAPITALETIEIPDLHTENGRIICNGDFQIFDLLGRDVTRLNGVYIVKVGERAQKVVVSSK